MIGRFFHRNLKIEVYTFIVTCRTYIRRGVFMKKLNAGLLSLLLGLSICISGCGKTSGDNAQKDASAQGENQSITLLNIKGH